MSTDLSGLGKSFAAGATCPDDVCEESLDRIAAHDGVVRAFVHVDAAGARAAARASTARWRNGTPLSPLDGVPIAVKANIAVQGLPWHAGVAAWRDRTAPADAACISRLRQYGIVILGVLNMHEAAFGGTTDNPNFGRTQNPWAHGHTAGGSSGGSAASVAAGFCAAAVGTDTLGSVRIPSAYCGVFGHKPGAGTMDLGGIVPLSTTFDQLGVHARSAADCGALFTALSGRRIAVAPPAGRIAVLRVEDQMEIDPALRTALDGAAARAADAGYVVENLTLPDVEYSRLRRLALLVIETEAALFYRDLIRAKPDGFSSDMRGMLAWAAAQTATRLQSAHADLAAFASAFSMHAAEFMAILAPVTPQTAFSWQESVPANQADLTALASIAGLPAIAVPSGRARGLPLSIQVISVADDLTLSVAAAISEQEIAACAFP